MVPSYLTPVHTTIINSSRYFRGRWKSAPRFFLAWIDSLLIGRFILTDERISLRLPAHRNIWSQARNCYSYETCSFYAIVMPYAFVCHNECCFCVYLRWCSNVGLLCLRLLIRRSLWSRPLTPKVMHNRASRCCLIGVCCLIRNGWRAWWSRARQRGPRALAAKGLKEANGPRKRSVIQSILHRIRETTGWLGTSWGGCWEGAAYSARTLTIVGCLFSVWSEVSAEYWNIFLSKSIH